MRECFNAEMLNRITDTGNGYWVLRLVTATEKFYFPLPLTLTMMV